MKNVTEKDEFGVLGFSKTNGLYWIDPKGDFHYANEEPRERSNGTVEYTMRFEFVSQHLKWLQREILTIIEATADKEKLNAVKELVKDRFNAKISWLYETSGLMENQQDGLSDED